MRILLALLVVAGLGVGLFVLLGSDPGEEAAGPSRAPDLDLDAPRNTTRRGPEALSGSDYVAPPARLPEEELTSRLASFEGGVLPKIAGDRPLHGRDILPLLPEAIPIEFVSDAERDRFENQKFVEWIPRVPDSRFGADLRRWLHDGGWDLQTHEGRLRIWRHEEERETSVAPW